MKNLYLLFIIVTFLGCNKEDNKYKYEAEQKQHTIDSLKLMLVKETDKKLFDDAIYLMSNKKYEKAVEMFLELNSKYPNSELLNESKNNLEICRENLNKIEQENIKELDEILKISKKLETEEAIKLIEDFLKKDITNDLIIKAKKELAYYKDEYKKNEAVRDFENGTGIKVLSCKAEWDLNSVYVTPFVRIKVKNISGEPIKSLKVIVQFLNKDKGEIFGDNLTYIQSSSDVPFESGYSKEAEVKSDKYLSSYAMSNLPSLVAKIYFEKKYNEKIYYKEIIIKKSFGN